MCFNKLMLLHDDVDDDNDADDVFHDNATFLSTPSYVCVYIFLLRMVIIVTFQQC